MHTVDTGNSYTTEEVNPLANDMVQAVLFTILTSIIG